MVKFYIQFPSSIATFRISKKLTKERCMLHWILWSSQSWSTIYVLSISSKQHKMPRWVSLILYTLRLWYISDILYWTNTGSSLQIWLLLGVLSMEAHQAKSARIRAKRVLDGVEKIQGKYKDANLTLRPRLSISAKAISQYSCRSDI